MNNKNLRQSVCNALLESTPNNLTNFTLLNEAAGSIKKSSLIDQFSIFNEKHIEIAKNTWKLFFNS